MAEMYDLVIVGSGTAASVAAFQAAGAGWRVAVIDNRPLGGTCALRGCDPKKMMVSAEEALEAARRLCGKGVLGGLRIDWAQLIAFKRSFTDPIPEKRRKSFAERGIDTFEGLARFVAPDRMAVDGRELAFRHALIAAGAKPEPLGIVGEELVVTSDDFLELEQLPARILFVGGGYIAAEFSQLAARAGSMVTVVQRGASLLEHFDPEVVGWLMPRFQELGIRLQLSAELIGVERAPSGLRVGVRAASGNIDHHESDLVVHAAGRVPDLDALDLQAGNVAAARGRLRLRPNLQSASNPLVYAAGDAAALGPPLTPVSSHDAKVAAANMLDGGERQPDYRGVPSVVFTVPPIASVGLREDQARAQRRKYRLNSALTPDWFSARRLGETIYGHKVLVESETGAILGAHLVGPHVDEVINIFAMAVRHRLKADDLEGTMFAYPTGASDISSMLP